MGGAMTSFIRIAIVNVLVFFALLAFGELLLRSAWTVRSCFNLNCDLSRITRDLKVYHLGILPRDIKLTRFDDRLGYVPHEGFDAVINDPDFGWRDVKVTITREGFRLNNLGMAPHTDVLVVGD